MVVRLTLALLAMATGLIATTLTGTLRNPDGTQPTGQLYFQVAQQAALKTTGGCGGPIEVVPAWIWFQVTSGSLPGGTTLYGNDCLLPQNTYYNVYFKDTNGNVLFTDRWVITGASIDIGTIVSAVVTGTTGMLGATGVVMMVPGAAQTITQSSSATPLAVDYLSVTQSLTSAILSLTGSRPTSSATTCTTLRMTMAAGNLYLCGPSGSVRFVGTTF